jgi:hypothetical protein
MIFKVLLRDYLTAKSLPCRLIGGGGGVEYHKLNTFFPHIDISHRVSCLHAHQQNGSVERKYRHIIEVDLTLLPQASMPLKFWDEAFTTAVYLINRMPSKVINYEIPLERLFHIQPNYLSLRVSGCTCWPNIRPYNQHKLQFRSKQYVFLEYSNQHKGFKCLDVSTGCVYISCDVVFDETVYPFSKLHPNAGARLHDEISLLPNCDHDGVCLAANDSVLINSSNQLDEITTSCSYPRVGGEEIRENGEEINADLGEDCSSPKRHHMSNPDIVIE